MLRKASQWLVRRLEDVFASYGRFVARFPLIMIACCFVTTGLALIGMIRYRTENNAFKLWIPDNSDFVKNFEWLEENSPPDIRFNSLILATEGNILSPSVLLHMVRLHSKVESLRSSPSSLSWEEVCYDIPVISLPDTRSDNSSDCDQPWLEPCYPSFWCPIISQLTSTACLEQSILEIWGYDEDVYLQLTQEDIIAKVNEPNLLSKIFNIPIDINNYLGEVERDSQGQIVSARATNMQWFGKINSSDISEDDISNMGTGEIVDTHSLEWEAALRDLLMEDRDSLPADLTSYINVARGYSDIAGDTIMGDAFMMPIGFMIMFAYVQIMLGKLNCVQSRAMLALAGLTCIGLSIGFTYGFCSALNLFYGPMHNLIPFLLLGIGVDDMFVIMQCFDNLSPAERSLDDIPSAVSLTMRRAGVAITVTSLTDFMVFVIGATTVLPALRSFCLWCAVGIIAVYVFQITLFAGSLALDCRRLRQGRNGFCPCYVHKDVMITDSQDQGGSEAGAGGEGFTKRCSKVVAGLVLSLPGRLMVLLVTALLLGCGVWQVTLLQQEFQSIWFLPPSSYLRQWFEANSRYFPGDGERVVVYMAEMDWPEDLARIEKLVTDLSQAEDIIKSVDSWYPAFKQFSNTNLGTDIPDTALDNATFNNHLTQFLYNADPSTLGLRFIPNFKFLEEKEVECGLPAPDILLSTFTFTHNKFSGRAQHIPALHQVKEIISQCQFSGLVFPFNQEYSNWETDEVITRELFRNLGIALACVFLTTLILLADLLGSILVLGTVALSLVDLCGFMHTWDISIDVVSAVNVIIAIGLCVDYSVHICHAFLTVSGSRKERAAAAMVDMGPAVLNGGVSTLIAFILLAGSDSHVFSVFFRIFLLVIIFGLFHGLILLPVVLSFIGPSSYDNAKPAVDNNHFDSREKMTIAL